MLSCCYYASPAAGVESTAPSRSPWRSHHPSPPAVRGPSCPRRSPRAGPTSLWLTGCRRDCEPVGAEAVGVSPCSGCETGHPSPPFAWRSATTLWPRPPRSGSRRRHDESPAGTVGLCHDPTTNGSTACRMRSASRLHGSGTCGPCAPPAARARRRLPGTTGLRFALHGRQRRWYPCAPCLSWKKVKVSVA